jgi:hypothetical protein
VVSLDEAIGKVRAACDARDALDPDFVVIARSEYPRTGSNPGRAAAKLIASCDRGFPDSLILFALLTGPAFEPSRGQRARRDGRLP